LLVPLTGTVLWWFAAWASSIDAGSTDLTAKLMFVGGLWEDVRSAYILLKLTCARKYGGFRDALLSFKHHVTRFTVPPNIEYLLSRCQEFMFLMLGETILQVRTSSLLDAFQNAVPQPCCPSSIDAVALLSRFDYSSRLDRRTQLVIAPRPVGAETHLPFYSTVISGFIVTLCMIHTTVITELHNRDGHVIHRDALAGQIWLTLFSVKAFAVMCVGVGYKLTLYKPQAPADGAYATTQRHLLGSSIGATFLLQLVTHPLHTGFSRYYSPMTLITHPRRTALIAARIFLGRRLQSSNQLTPLDHESQPS
jgi:hypothetical protein